MNTYKEYIKILTENKNNTDMLVNTTEDILEYTKKALIVYEDFQDIQNTCDLIQEISEYMLEDVEHITEYVNEMIYEMTRAYNQMEEAVLPEDEHTSLFNGLMDLFLQDYDEQSEEEKKETKEFVKKTYERLQEYRFDV